MTATQRSEPAAARERLREILLERSVQRGEFRLASGDVSSVFFDLKPTVMHPEGARLIGDLILEELAAIPERPLYVGGLETGAIPVVQAVITRAEGEVEGFFVRKKPKATGLRTRIDGNLAEGGRAVLLEDVTTRGNSVLSAVEAVREQGCEVDVVITVVDRQMGAEASLAGHGIRLVPVLTAADLGL